MKRALWVALVSSAAFSQNIADKTPSFDSADVHVSPPSINPTMHGGALRGGRYEVHTATMVDLISAAYNMEPDKILGGPSWLDWDRFNVIAKASQGTSRENLNLMLQSLLADRFKLVVHKDMKPMPTFVLTAGKPKMKQASGSGESGCKGVPQNPAPGAVPYQVVSCQNVTMVALADMLTRFGRGNYLADPVVDQTGLSGTWDLELKWTPRNRLAQAGPDGIGLLEAVDKQLGLKLEAKKAPTPVLIVDNVNQKPTPNDPSVTAKIPAPPPTEFEVASIKPSPLDARGQNGHMQNGRLDLRNYTLKQMIRIAWDLNNNDDMIVGLPKSADSDHYDLIAKVATSGPQNAEDIDYDTLQLMLRGLLGDRFGLKVHMEDRPISAYTMTATPAAQTKLQKADPQNRTNCKAASSAQNPMLNRLITCTNVTMTQFADVLQDMVSGYVKAPIKDATGLVGYWDLSVNFSGVNLLPGGNFDPNKAAETSVPNGSLSLPEAMLKQLGLKLQMEKRPIPVLVVDHVEDKPTQN
jgi:uncharacterized protein (TIGR03435 family)